MTVTRSSIMILTILVTWIFVLVYCAQPITVEYDDNASTTDTRAQHRDNTDTLDADSHQGLKSIHMELPSSKARREREHRSALVARRQQILSRRSFESARNFVARAPRQDDGLSTETVDALLAQETRIVAASPGKLESEQSAEAARATNADVKADLNEPENEELLIEQRETGDENPAASSAQKKPASGNLRSYHLIGHSNSSAEISPVSTTSSSVFSNNQKPPDAEGRKKNIVPMPDSLYNYFRPVESNIPVEDMSQFLYFGQKIQPELHNATSNGSLDPTTPAASSRRRYSTKRVSLTTTTPMGELEEIASEEMNIAIEKNKISKTKNAVYYRKTRPTDSTIATNIIPMKDSNGNSTKADSVADRFDGNNPSAHAGSQDQLPATSARGSMPAHVVAETRNATDSTQIPTRQPVSVNTSRSEEEVTVESEVSVESRPTDSSNRDVPLKRPGNTRISKNYVNRRKTFSAGIAGAVSTAGSEVGRTTTETSTLRIIVTEGNFAEGARIASRPAGTSTVKPADNREERVRAVASGSVPTPADAESPADGSATVTAQQEHQQQQQQHVYAYTITNVTRLLRNYTGPGLSGEEHGGDPEGSTGTDEITTGSPQRRQPPPPTPLLPRAGSGIEAARAPAELSAGTTAEPATAGESPDIPRKLPLTDLSRQCANDTAIAVHPHTGNKTRGTIRWNRTNFRANDHKFLRKSASAVLNQRSDTSGVDDDATPLKRPGVPNDQSAYAGDNKRFQRPIVVTGLQNTVSSVNRTVGLNVSAVSGERLPGERKVEDAVVGRAMQETMHFTEMRRESESEVHGNRTLQGVTEEVTNSTETIDGPALITGDPIMDDDRHSTAEIVPADESVGNDTKGRSIAVQSESESRVAADKSADNKSSSMTVTVAEAVDEMRKEAIETTVASPVFPVTPKIITEAGRGLPESETFTLKSTLSANRQTDTGTTEPEKPFGIPANLDPSEIQKLYRSKNATATEPPIAPTTPLPLPTTTAFPDPRNQMAGERSPDVRARNLSDKSKDKDDVLPIMHLYNTTDFFNGSGSMHSISREVERPRVELPVGVNAHERERPEAPRPTGMVGPTIATGGPRIAWNDTNLGQTAPPSSKEPTGAQSNSKNNRDPPTQVPPTGPGRGYTSVNASATNRTRQKPVYHHPALPEYNSTVYANELNRTFFDAGLISVSPRESVNINEVISKRHDGDAIASQETVAVVSYILATLVVFPIAVGVGLILRRLILRNRKVLEESDTSSEISCRKDALNLESGDFKTSIEKAITKLPRIQHLCHEAEKPPPPSSQESRWEFPRDKLRLQTVLGQGNFGQVWKAEADDLTGHQGTTRLVAVKTVKEGASDREKEDLVRELEIMQQLGSHPNVVTLLGCCTEEEPHYLILEYVMYGKLLAYLRDHRTRQDFYNFSEDSAALTSRDLTVFGYCVARGMEYLASKKIIHRDLAARNVLVDHNKLCKIADFGMSRFANEDGEVIETRHGRNALPIRWMAPESLIYSLFTTKTDVWSFGILMWEIVTLGSTPYPDMTAREVMRNVQNGYRLERPSHCRSELFRVISRCWNADPDRRPEFQTLRRDLAQLLEDNMNGHYVDLESFASECTD